MNDVLGYIAGAALLSPLLVPLVFVVMACIRDTRNYKTAAAVALICVSLSMSSCSYTRSGYSAPGKSEDQQRTSRFGHFLIVDTEISTEFYPFIVAILFAILLNRSSKPPRTDQDKAR